MPLLAPILSILAPLLSWFTRAVLIKFVFLVGIFAVLELVIPLCISYVLYVIDLNSLTNSFALIDSGVWFWMDLFNISFGLPLLISAGIARFLIRRLPLIG